MYVTMQFFFSWKHLTWVIVARCNIKKLSPRGKKTFNSKKKKKWSHSSQRNLTVKWKGLTEEMNNKLDILTCLILFSNSNLVTEKAKNWNTKISFHGISLKLAKSHKYVLKNSCQSGMVVHAYNLSIRGWDRRITVSLRPLLGYIMSYRPAWTTQQYLIPENKTKLWLQCIHCFKNQHIKMSSWKLSKLVPIYQLQRMPSYNLI